MPATNYGLRENLVIQLDANGSGQGRIVNNNAATLWIIRQVSVVAAPKIRGATCTVTPPTGIVDTSYFAGTGDVAGGDPPYYCYASEYLQLDWVRGPANGTGIATYYYDEVFL